MALVRPAADLQLPSIFAIGGEQQEPLFSPVRDKIARGVRGSGQAIHLRERKRKHTFLADVAAYAPRCAPRKRGERFAFPHQREPTRANRLRDTVEDCGALLFAASHRAPRQLIDASDASTDVPTIPWRNVLLRGDHAGGVCDGEFVREALLLSVPLHPDLAHKVIDEHVCVLDQSLPVRQESCHECRTRNAIIRADAVADLPC